jgi:hypothetical protein
MNPRETEGYTDLFTRYTSRQMKYQRGNKIQVTLSGGRIVEAEVKAVHETTDGLRLQVSFGDETALIYEWQIIQPKRGKS